VERTQSSAVIAVSLMAANVVWLAGLTRLFGEGITRVLSGIAPTESEQRTAIPAIVITVAISSVVLLVIWRSSWYRGLLRQSREDLRSLWGLRPEATPARGTGLRRVAGVSVLVVVLAVTLAAFMPGAIPAAVAVILGLVARTGLAVIVVDSAKG